MQSISNIISNIVGVDVDQTENSELSIEKSTDDLNGIFFAPYRASAINMVCNTVGSLDYLVDFAILNNISLTSVNNKTKKVLFLKSKTSDDAVAKIISSKNINFITEIPGAAVPSGFLLQESGKYINQENTYKIKL